MSKEALAQEPVAYFETITGRIAVRDDTHRRKFPMCYRPLVFGDTSPPQRKPLTYEQRNTLIRQECRYTSEAATEDHHRLIEAVELLHNIKE